MPRLFPYYHKMDNLFMNKYSGGNFDDFLKEEGIFEEVTEHALKRLLILQLGDIITVLIQQETMLVAKNKNEKGCLEDFIEIH